MEGRRVPRLSLDLLRGFHAAARHLSFTRAAQELFVTQPAISHGVKTLEEQLGKPLFLRVNRALQLTQAGRDLFSEVDEGLALIDAATMRVADACRTLSVTTTVAMASTWLVPRLSRFARLHPELALDRARPLRTAADLARHVLIDFETVLYGRPWFDWQQWVDAVKLRGVKGDGWLRFSHYDQVIEAAIKGSGVAIGKRPYLSEHLRKGLLVAPLGAQCVARPGAFYVEVSEAAQQEMVEVFVNWLHAEARRDTRAPRRRTPPA